MHDAVVRWSIFLRIIVDVWSRARNAEMHAIFPANARHNNNNPKQQEKTGHKIFTLPGPPLI